MNEWMNECNFYVTPRLNPRASALGQFGPCDSITHTEIVHTIMWLSVMPRSCAGPKSFRSCFPLWKLRLGVPSALLKNLTDLHNGYHPCEWSLKQPSLVPSFLFLASEIELLESLPLLHIRCCQFLPAPPANRGFTNSFFTFRSGVLRLVSGKRGSTDRRITDYVATTN